MGVPDSTGPRFAPPTDIKPLEPQSQTQEASKHVTSVLVKGIQVMMQYAQDEAQKTIEAGKLQRQKAMKEAVQAMVQGRLQVFVADLIKQFKANFDAEKFKQIMEKNKPAP